VFEAVTGAPLEHVITELVLRPLDMGHTGFTAAPDRPRATGYVRAPRILHPLVRALLPRSIVGPRVDGYLSLQPFLVEGAAYGGLVGTASDAVKLAAAHLRPHAGTDDSGPVGDLSQMQNIGYPGRPFDHGIGWFRKPADAARAPAFVEHYGTGGGFWNAMRIYPDLGIAAVGMTNATTSWPFDTFFATVVDDLHRNNRSQAI
jgi:CubicO group peptidase (beta-lactamase class C family)